MSSFTFDEVYQALIAGAERPSLIARNEGSKEDFIERVRKHLRTEIAGNHWRYVPVIETAMYGRPDMGGTSQEREVARATDYVLRMYMASCKGAEWER